MNARFSQAWLYSSLFEWYQANGRSIATNERKLQSDTQVLRSLKIKSVQFEVVLSLPACLCVYFCFGTVNVILFQKRPEYIAKTIVTKSSPRALILTRLAYAVIARVQKSTHTIMSKRIALKLHHAVINREHFLLVIIYC